MAVSRKARASVVAAIVLLVGLWIVNNFVYPFSSVSPNYSDVERVFERMQFPAEWDEIDSSENRGLHGRACPIESSSRCFQKGKRFKVPKDTDYKIIEGVFKQTGCPVVSVNRSEPIGSDAYANFECSIEGLTIDGGVTEKGIDSWEASIYVST